MRKFTLALIALLPLLSSCDLDEELGLSASTIEMYAGESYKLKVTGFSFYTTEWYTDDYFVADVDSYGYVYANHVGETYIDAVVGTDVFSCKVYVDPYYYLYDDPYLRFGASMTTVYRNETRELAEESRDALVFYDGYANTVVYIFESDVFVGVAMILSYRFYSDEEIFGALDERYEIAGDSNGVYYWTDRNMNITLSYESDGIYIVYEDIYKAIGQSNDILEKVKTYGAEADPQAREAQRPLK